MADMKLIKDMSAALNARPRQPEPYDTTAEVTRVEGDVAWVHIPGGVDETPVQMSVNARIGDTVRVRVGGGTAWLTGNDTAPPTDDKKAIEAQTKAEEVSDYVATHMEETDAGLVITKDGSGWKLLVASDGVDIIDPNGTSVANYGATARIGNSGDLHIEIDGDSIKMVSPVLDLVSFDLNESLPEDGTYSGGAVMMSGLAAGASKKTAEKIVVDEDHPFIAYVNSGSSATYTDYGTYTYNSSFSIILEQDGFSLRNDTESAITNITFHLTEYYATHYYGFYDFKNGSIKLSNHETVDGLDVSELACTATNHSYIVTDFLASGMITGGRQDIRFFIPYSVISGTATIEDLALAIRTADGGYPYFRSGSSGNTYTQITTDTQIIENSEFVRDGEFRAACVCTVVPRSGFIVRLYLNYAATTDTSGTLITNNIPLIIEGNITINLD